MGISLLCNSSTIANSRWKNEKWKKRKVWGRRKGGRRPTWSVMLRWMIVVFSKILRANDCPESMFLAYFTFPKLPSPSVLPISYFPNRIPLSLLLLLLLLLITPILFLFSISFSSPENHPTIQINYDPPLLFLPSPSVLLWKRLLCISISKSNNKWPGYQFFPNDGVSIALSLSPFLSLYLCRSLGRQIPGWITGGGVYC